MELNETLDIKKTNDYSQFKKLNGNRKVLEPRVRKIMKSIEKVGYIPTAITVNEKLEVIDGQGRLEALRRLELPVYYNVVPGIGIEECIAMNINQGNWTKADYIDSYADLGDENYIRLRDLLQNSGNLFCDKVILYAATGKTETINSIKNGSFECSKADYDRAVRTLKWLTSFKDLFSKKMGHTEFYFMAVIFCYWCNDIDEKRLYSKISAMRASLIPVTNMQQAFQQIENVYNHRLTTKVHIEDRYRLYLEGKYSWYSGKYGSRY